METITSMAQTAAKAVWGNGTERDEPISGVQGDVAKGEPFDGGNIDPLESNKGGSEFETETSNELKKSNSSTKDPAIGTETSKDLKNSNATKDPVVTSTDEPAPAEKPPSRDTRDSNEADAGEDGEEGVMGDGPRPLATVAKECGGDAGNMKTEPEPESESSGDAAAGKDGDGEGKGTGELYVKASGLAADGGDFDAAKPGAGREADRLMEENGIKREAGHDSKPSKLDSMSSGSGSKDDNEKPSMKDRIKDKLHLHKS